MCIVYVCVRVCKSERGCDAQVGLFLPVVFAWVFPALFPSQHDCCFLVVAFCCYSDFFYNLCYLSRLLVATFGNTSLLSAVSVYIMCIYNNYTQLYTLPL